MTQKGKPRTLGIRFVANGDAMPEERAVFRLQQPGYQPQEAGFAAAIGSAQQQKAAGRQRKGKIREHEALAAPAGKPAAFEALR